MPASMNLRPQDQLTSPKETCECLSTERGGGIENPFVIGGKGDNAYSRVLLSSVSRMIDGAKVNPGDFTDSLKELANVCMLCNDSGLAYNEVHTCLAYSTTFTPH